MASISTRRLLIAFLLAAVCLGLFAGAALAAEGDVTLTRGPTSIINGTCLGANDITVSNGIFAIAISVDTVPPWGVPNGSILDGTLVKDGAIGNDRLTLVDFLPDGWDAWPSSTPVVTVPTETADQVVVQVDRDYTDTSGHLVELVTTYTVDRDSKFVDIKTIATNTAATATEQIYSGYTFCTTGGFMFGPYGKAPDWTVSDPYGKYVLGYDKDYSIGLHFPEATVHDGGTGWKDLYELNSLAAGEAKTYEAVVEFEDSASISRFVKHVADEREDTTAAVSGTVAPVAGATFPEPPIVVVEKNGETFTWAVAEGGNYSLDLPAGRYELYAVAKDFSPTAKVPVTVAAEPVTQDFADLTPMSKVTVKVTKAGTTTPLDARIKVSGGIPPVVGFLGKSVFFTDLKKVGVASFNLAAGELKLKVTAGDKFQSRAVEVPIAVVEGQDQTVPVKIHRLFKMSVYRWFAGDLHHHSDLLDGATPPEYVVRSQLAAGLDFTFISDHDLFTNNQTIKDLSATRGVPFISSDEISPIWAHFNVYPVSLVSPVVVNPAGTAKQIIDQAHAAGMTIAINHPYIAYGYFNAQEQGTIPGGYDDAYDLIELQGTEGGKETDPDSRTFAKAMELWTGALTGANKKHYITGGYDMHDVWSDDYMSGDVRTFVHIPGGSAVNQKNFLANLKAGHSYVTMGPLVRPLNGLDFGKTLAVKRSVSRVTFSLKAFSVYGLKSIQVLRGGVVVRSLTIGDKSTSETVTFSIRNREKAWYNFVVEDQNGARAITNPVWTRMVD